MQSRIERAGLLRNPFIRHDAARIVTMTLFDP
jgi:hypothetical protein